jgi:hypothetical protein
MDGEALTAETYRADRGLQQMGAHWDSVGPAANRPVAAQFVDGGHGHGHDHSTALEGLSWQWGA